MYRIDRRLLIYSALMMELMPTISFEQYKASVAALLAAKPKRSPKRSWRQLLILFVLCLGLGISLQIDATRTPAITLYAAMIFFWALSKPISRNFQNKQLKCFFDEEEATLNDQILMIDNHGISCNTRDGKATSHRAWQTFTGRIPLSSVAEYLRTSPEGHAHRIGSKPYS